MTKIESNEASQQSLELLLQKIRKCEHCKSRFAETVSAHQPRPVLRASVTAKVCIAGQAPGIRVHESGRPFTDPSGDRLRNWMQTSEEVFYDQARLAILPMGFCFPGHDARRGDLPPPKECARLWRTLYSRNCRNSN